MPSFMMSLRLGGAPVIERATISQARLLAGRIKIKTCRVFPSAAPRIKPMRRSQVASSDVGATDRGAAYRIAATINPPEAEIRAGSLQE
jgi:hypothetical protein